MELAAVVAALEQSVVGAAGDERPGVEVAGVGEPGVDVPGVEPPGIAVTDVGVSCHLCKSGVVHHRIAVWADRRSVL